MMMTACGLFFVAFEVFFSFNDAQIMISDSTCSMVSKTSFYEEVKDELLLQFASVVEEIRTVSVQNRQDVSNLTVLVSNLENKIRNENEKCFAKVTNDVKILERKTQKICQRMENLESRMTARFQETGSLLNLTDISSEENITGLSSDIRNCQFSVDNDDTTLENDLSEKNAEISFRMDNLSKTIHNLSKKINSIDNSTYQLTRRFSSIETQLSRVSTKLTDFVSNFEIRIPDTIRLVNGGSTYGGVEVFYNGQWGTVCDDNWDNDDAGVVCRMFGLRGGQAMKTATYGQGSQNIWLDDVDCSGSELSIFNCTFPDVGIHNCNHGVDAGVICS